MKCFNNLIDFVSNVDWEQCGYISQTAISVFFA